MLLHRNAPFPSSQFDRHRTACRATQQSPPDASQPKRKLILLRHGDSAASSARDHDRVLSPLGREEAVKTANKLEAMGWHPDVVLASNAKRTKETLDQMATALSSLMDADAHFYGSLYTAAALDGQTRQHLTECMLEVVDESKHLCVLCVGHNKGWEEAASSWAGKAVKLHTASAALLQVASSSWKEALAEDSKVKWELVGVIGPK